MDTKKHWLVSTPSQEMTVSSFFESQRITVGKWLKRITDSFTFFRRLELNRTWMKIFFQNWKNMSAMFKKNNANAVCYEIFKHKKERKERKDSGFVFAASMSTIIAAALPTIKLHRKSAEVLLTNEHWLRWYRAQRKEKSSGWMLLSLKR